LILAAIPSPGTNAIEIGPLSLRAYGLMIALGVVAAVWLSRRRWAERGGDPEDISAIALWAVPAGLVGARIYHVVTDNQLYRGRWIEALYLWEGGLGIPGGIALGAAVGVWVGHRRGCRVAPLLDAVAPSLPLAQAIGRWGNWFNQELFGRPTDLPWALEIDPSHRPDRFADQATFHPTFLYESLWNLALCLVLVRIDRTRRLAPGSLFPLYVGGYAIGRLWVEALRVDPANEILGLRLNTWVSGALVLGAAAAFAWLQRRACRPAGGVAAAPYREGAGPAADAPAAGDAGGAAVPGPEAGTGAGLDAGTGAGRDAGPPGDDGRPGG
jgi:prolipoprotein diacylglyceryl transferase